jgi:hypothetical protein
MMREQDILQVRGEAGGDVWVQIRYMAYELDEAEGVLGQFVFENGERQGTGARLAL